MSNHPATSMTPSGAQASPGQATVQTAMAGASAAVGFEAEWEEACDSALNGMDLSTPPDLLMVFVDSATPHTTKRSSPGCESGPALNT